MLALLSPAKKQDFISNIPAISSSQIQTKSDVAKLVLELKKLKPTQIKKLMSVSDKIAKLNAERFKDFDPQQYTLNNARQAALAFQGDAYRSMDFISLSKASIDYAQSHLMLLSGLYGYLRPLDLIQAYRLEMKTLLANPQGDDLYTFWGDRISKGINKALNKIDCDTVVNLASNEYFKAVDLNALKAKVIHIEFREHKNGQYKIIGINAKRGRGAMARYMMQHKVKTLKQLTQFDALNYQFNKSLSNDYNLVFTCS